MKSRLLLTAAALVLCCSAAATAQQATPTPTPDNTVTEKGFRSRIFEIKHREASSIVRVLAPLSSGFRGATMISNQDFQTITVRDFPENIVAIEEGIRRLDVPEPVRPGVEFHVHVLVATRSPTFSPPNQFPEELGAVINQLKTTINYSHYHLMTSQVLRTKEQGMRQVSIKGVSELKMRADTEASKNPIFYDFRFENVVLDTTTPGAGKIQVGQFGFSMKVPVQVGGPVSIQYETIGFNTPVNLREGEKVVVGTTSMEDKGIVVVITGSITK